jgi:hypothetical protein
MRFIFQQHKSNFTCNPGDTLALVLIYASSFVLYVDVALSLLSELRPCMGHGRLFKTGLIAYFARYIKLILMQT